MRLSPGDRVDRYVLEAPLGEGGAAEVWRVRHAVLGTPHALKVLTVRSGSVLRRTLQEGQLQARLRHENLVPVTDVVDVDGAPGLVMELVEGASLEGLIERGGLDRAAVDHLARGILAGVAAAHDQGVVHRDLKPANVLVSWGDGPPVARVTDFGIAKVLDADEGGGPRTRDGSFMGTPAYMAPEQTASARAVDARSDVFALGAVLYELVSGRRAFPQDDLVDVLSAIRDGRFVPVRALVPDLPEAWEAAIGAALRTDPSLRPPDARALLALWDGGRPAPAPAPQARRVAATWHDATPPPSPRVTVRAAPGPLEALPAREVPPELLGEERAPPPRPPEPTPAPAPPRRAGLAVGALLAGALGLVGLVGVALALALALLRPAAPAPAELPLPEPPAPAVDPPAPAAAAPAPSPRPEPARVRGPRGTLRLHSTPVAEVRVDGRRAPDTRAFSQELPAGMHQIELTAHGSTEPVLLRARVQAGEVAELCWDFDAGAFCSAEVWARISAGP